MNRKVNGLGGLLMLCAGAAFGGKAQAAYPTGAYPKFIISADFRNDGINDIVTANYHGSSISVLLGNGNGTLQTAVNYPVGGYPTGLAAADFRGVGILDLVVANAIDPHPTGPCPNCGLQGVSVLLGNGDGTFQPNVFLAVASGTAWVSAKDVNGDGKPDIIAADWRAGMVSILLGNGDGTFQPAINIPVGEVPHSIAVADFNGDGILDLAVGNMYSNNVEILIGVGNGNFTPAGTFAVGQIPHSICHGDFNGDGFVDLATANIDSNSVTVLLGNGDGTFQPGVNYPTAKGTTSIYPADFNRDGITDLAAANSGVSSAGLDAEDSTAPHPSSVSILIGNGDGTFQPAVNYNTGDGGNGLVSTILTPNGLQDLAICFFGSYVRVLFGYGNGTFKPLAIPSSTTLDSSLNPSRVSAGGHDLAASYGGDATGATSGQPSPPQILQCCAALESSLDNWAVSGKRAGAARHVLYTASAGQSASGTEGKVLRFVSFGRLVLNS